MIDRQSHYRKLENMYLQANVNREAYLGTKIRVGEKEAEISMPIDKRYFHALHALHGSVYFKLLDDAAFFAANSVVFDVFVLTTSFYINLFRPVNAGIITATGKLTFQTTNLLTAEAVLYNENEKKIAAGTGNFARSRIALSDKIGYR